jgi:hypothetical protein
LDFVLGLGQLNIQSQSKSKICLAWFAFSFNISVVEHYKICRWDIPPTIIFFAENHLASLGIRQMPPREGTKISSVFYGAHYRRRRL